MLKNIVLLLILYTSVFADVFDFSTNSPSGDGTTVTQTINGVTVTVSSSIGNTDLVANRVMVDYASGGQTATSMTVSFSQAVNVSSFFLDNNNNLAYWARITASSGSVVSQYINDGGEIVYASNFNSITSFTITETSTDVDQVNFVIDNINFTIPDPSAPEIKITGSSLEISDGDTTPYVSDYTDFGNLDIGTSKTRSFKILNEGDATLNLTGAYPYVSISGDSSFSLITKPSASVLASGETSFSIRFNPTTTGTKAATISIANDDSNENPYNFSIKGEGLASPEINVKSNSITIYDGDTTPSENDNTDFKSANVDGSTISKEFTIENTGNATLNLDIDAVTVSGDFNVISQPATTVAAGGTSTFTVEFDPATVGLRSGTLSIINDDSTENPYNFSIQGTGTSSPIITSTPILSVDEDVLYQYQLEASDADGDSLVWSITTDTTLPEWLLLNGSILSGTPTNNNIGVYDINLTLSDGTNNINHSFQVTTFNVNDEPTSSNIIFTINEDNNKVFTLGDFIFTDADVEDELDSIYITTLQSAGNLQLSGVDVVLNQRITVANLTNLVFVPVSNEFNTPYSTFKFKVNDGDLNSTLEYAVTINVLGVDDIPIIDTEFTNQTVTNNSTYTYSINIHDIDGDSLNLNIDSNNSEAIILTQNWTNPISQAMWSTQSFSFDINTSVETQSIVNIIITIDDFDKNMSKSFNVTIEVDDSGNINPSVLMYLLN